MAAKPRSPVNLLRVLLEAEWFGSAIEFHPATNLDGEDLREEAEASVAAHDEQFKTDVAYMAVPRCDGCLFWSRPPYGANKSACQHPERKVTAGDDGLVWTTADFGCVQWEAQS